MTITNSGPTANAVTGATGEDTTTLITTSPSAEDDSIPS